MVYIPYYQIQQIQIMLTLSLSTPILLDSQIERSVTLNCKASVLQLPGGQTKQEVNHKSLFVYMIKTKIRTKEPFGTEANGEHYEIQPNQEPNPTHT